MLRIVLWALLGTGLVLAQVDEKVIRPGQNDDCATHCKKTFALHTSQQPATKVSACSEGCQLSAILQLNGGTPGMSASQECSQACAEVYKADTTPACQTGCKHEQPFTNGHMEIHMSADSPLAGYMSKSMNQGMFGLLSNIQRNMMQRMSNLLGADLMSGAEPDEHRNLLGRPDGHMPPWLLTDADTHRNMLGAPGGHGHMMMHGTPRGHGHMMMDGAPDGHMMMQGAPDGHMMMQDAPDGRMMMHGAPKDRTHRLIGGQHDAGSDSDSTSRESHTNKFMALINSLQRQMDKDFDSDMRAMMGNLDELRADGHDVNTLESVRAHEPSPPVVRYAHHDQQRNADTWMACLSRRAHHLSRMSRYMLCAGMMLCVLSMCFICIALLRSGKRRTNTGGVMHTRCTHASAMPFKKPQYADIEKTPLELSCDLSDTQSEAPDYARVHDTVPPPYQAQATDQQADPLPEKAAL